jgi:hypothetical protein
MFERISKASKKIYKYVDKLDKQCSVYNHLQKASTSDTYIYPRIKAFLIKLFIVWVSLVPYIIIAGIVNDYFGHKYSKYIFEALIGVSVISPVFFFKGLITGRDFWVLDAYKKFIFQNALKVLILGLVLLLILFAITVFLDIGLPGFILILFVIALPYAFIALIAFVAYRVYKKIKT